MTNFYSKKLQSGVDDPPDGNWISSLIDISNERLVEDTRSAFTRSEVNTYRVILNKTIFGKKIREKKNEKIVLFKMSLIEFHIIAFKGNSKEKGERSFQNINS